MRKEVFELLSAIKSDGIDDWGICENVFTAPYFGTSENVYLKGKHLYIYKDNDCFCPDLDKLKSDLVFNNEDESFTILFFNID